MRMRRPMDSLLKKGEEKDADVVDPNSGLQSGLTVHFQEIQGFLDIGYLNRFDPSLGLIPVL